MRLRRVDIIDTTLRDGEQAAGVAFSVRQKVAIAESLDQAGVQWIEAGTPIMGGSELKALKAIIKAGLNAVVFSWNRAVKEDIMASIKAGFSFLHISVPVSDLHIEHKLGRSRDWVIDRLKNSILLAQSYGCEVSVGAEDASRADLAFFLSIADIAASMGAVRIRYADTVGCMNPFIVHDTMLYLAQRCPLPIELHVHNDFGLAVANTAAGIEAGVSAVSATVTGMGERAGNAAMEELIPLMEDLMGINTGISSQMLKETCSLVTAASRRPIYPYKPMLGEMMPG